ncbi:MAG: class I SAM-dependent methyltransferase [Nitrospirae bacterium]|nr:class I SAM-dependent methyltransferase [Nitrospirota bacterium]
MKPCGKGLLKYQHTDSALRYLPIVDDIRSSGQKNKILEIGAGGLGIYPYLGEKIYAVDVSFDSIRNDQVLMVSSNAQTLPFKDKTFDIVIAVDMLEHIPPLLRMNVIRELLRVAIKKVYIAFPSGPYAEAHDRKYHQYYMSKKGTSFHFFEEHLEYGLPDKAFVEERIMEAAKNMGRRVKISKSNNVNILLRNLLMFLWINNYNTIYHYTMVLCSIRRWLNMGKCYRSIFVVQFDGQ